MQITTLRNWQFQQLENNIKSVEWLVRMSDPGALNTYRDGGTGWTALEVVCHLRDYEDVFIQRARLAVEQENPPLPNPNPDELAAERRYNEQQVDAALAAWKWLRAEYVGYMRQRGEGDWERTAMHPTRGQMTLMDQLWLVTLHDTIHLEQMTRLLHEKRAP